MMFLAIDVGTSELKVVVFDAVGNGLKTVRTEVQGISVSGCRIEVDPEAIWQAVRQGIQCLGAKLQLCIGAAAISSQGESFVGLDDQGTPTGNVILNVDSRATHEMAEFTVAFGQQRLYEKTGLAPHPKYTLPKIAWLRRHQPKIFSRSVRFLCVEDYLLSRLQIDPVISRSLASRTLGFDIQRNAWDSELLKFSGISERQLSRVERSGTVVGTASVKISGELGLPTDMVWCTAGHDQACASIGAGALRSGTVTDGTGTFECASIHLKQALVSATSLTANLSCESHVIPEHFLTTASVPGGIVLKWLRENFAHPKDYSYDTMLAGLPIEPTGIFCFPYFLGTGTPWLDSQAKGAVYGLTSATTDQSLAQAILEGVSYEMRWNFEALRGMGIPIEQVFAVGGGAKSDAWLQLKSDVFGCSVVRIPGEASARGAAICAAMAVGEYGDWNEAVSAMVRCGRVFEPRPEAQRRYQELFEEYKHLAHRIYGYKLPPEQS
jgi:xylulokinase